MHLGEGELELNIRLDMSYRNAVTGIEADGALGNLRSGEFTWSCLNGSDEEGGDRAEKSRVLHGGCLCL